jgi:glycerol dehydrogenase-like iron-containing ADH family enzyme
MNKRRLSASVDADLITAAERAVAAGLADSVSAWINDAMHRKAEEDERLAVLDKFLSRYEAKHGKITTEDVEAAKRWRRTRAIVVRGGRVLTGKRRRAR